MQPAPYSLFGEIATRCGKCRTRRHDQFLRQEEMRKRNNMELEEDTFRNCFGVFAAFVDMGSKVPCKLSVLPTYQLPIRRSGGRCRSKRDLIAKQLLWGHQAQGLFEA